MAKETKKKERRPPETQTQFFCAVVQADYAAQMDVMRWLMQDRQYLCISALHDKDTYTAEDIAEKGENDVYTRTNGDGTQSQYRAGDAKPREQTAHSGQRSADIAHPGGAIVIDI